jgi:hypothetical protein
MPANADSTFTDEELDAAMNRPLDEAVATLTRIETQVEQLLDDLKSLQARLSRLEEEDEPDAR